MQLKATLSALCLLGGLPAQAQTTLNGDHVVAGNLTVNNDLHVNTDMYLSRNLNFNIGGGSQLGI